MRRVPRQARSREMVERIVAAGRAVLVEEGYDRFSTNQVARRAGVSPGSLYQYFPDKAAVVDRVVEGWSDDVSEQVAASLTDRVGATGPDLVRPVLESLLDAVSADPELLRVVMTELPASRHLARRSALQRRVREVATTYLRARPESHRRPDPAVAAWVMVVAIEAVVVQWVLAPGGLTRVQVVDELAALVQGHLAQVGQEAPPAN